MTEEEVRLAYKMADRMARRFAPRWMDFQDVKQEYAIAGWTAYEKIGHFHVGYVRRSMWNRFLDLAVSPHMECVSIHLEPHDDEESTGFVIEPMHYDLYLPAPKDAEMRSLIIALATYRKDEARQHLGFSNNAWQKKMAGVRRYVEDCTL